MQPLWLVLIWVVGAEIGPREATAHDCWLLQKSGVTVSLRGLSAVDGKVCWASGAGGTVLRTIDAGESWQSVSPAGMSALDFRDIEAWGPDEAVAMSAGDVDRLVRTTDGGQTWSVCYEHPDSHAFFDGLAFWDRRHGILMGDPIDGRLLILLTSDGGESWEPLSPEQCPAVEDGEAGFAASGTNLCVGDGGKVWIVLGGAPAGQTAPVSHVWRSSDYGRTWELSAAPLPRSPTQGIFSIAARSPEELCVVGGDYQRPDRALGNVAFSTDGGQTWRVPKNSVPSGYRSAVAAVPHSRPAMWLATGPTGTDSSLDGGDTWHRASEHGFHTVSFADDGAGWAAGAEGRIARFQRH